MSFTSPLFLLLLPLTFVASWAAVRRPALRRAILLTASVAFYAAAGLSALALCLAVVAFCWATALRARTSRLAFAAGVAAPIALLAFFKYVGFFTEGAWLLPVGISFYVFQAVGYVIDVRRGHVEPRGLREVALFLLFFPQLVAGPIVRGAELFPQLEDDKPRLWDSMGAVALFRIALGLAKKLLLADPLAALLVDRPFADPGSFSSVECLLAVWAYAFVLWADFSAYTDIAVGSARLFGVTLPENFLTPYKAGSITEFWRRWHVTLSRWFKDYVYVPLGGRRHGRARNAAALLVTMTLAGLWHGSGLTFLSFGAFHGALLVGERLLGRHERTGLGARVITFHLVCLGWVLFRAEDLPAAWALLARIGSLTTGAANVSLPALALLLGVVALHFAGDRALSWPKERFVSLPPLARAALLLLLAVGARQLGSAEAPPFIYFRF